MKNVALYVRVSTAEQKNHGLSVDNQIQALTQYCKDNNYNIQGIYNDAGISARKSYKKRPELLKMIEACQEKRVDLVLFTRLDRFFRSVPDYYACVEQMAGVPWRAIWEDYDTESSSGLFKVNILLSISQAEADRTSEKIKSVKEYSRLQGWYVGGSAPLGYKVQGHDLIKDESQAELVELIFKTYLQTHSVTRVLETIRKAGSTRSKNGVYNMLINSTYMGVTACGYKCEPYISEEEYLEIKRFLGSTCIHRKEKTKYTYLFNGLLRCAYCGGNVLGTTATKVRGGERRVYKYYRCMGWLNRTCTQANNISETKIEKQLIEMLDDEFKNYQINAEVSKIDTKKVKNQISALESKLERIGERFEDGDISREEYREKRDSIKKEIDSLKAQQKPISKSIPKEWRSIYNELDETHRKYFWNQSVNSIVIEHGVKSIVF